ncbi:MAG: hypothetical protein H0T42_34395, partial [Deltaproteobacteria bacterium]|nr:hypothetical protein [Deltaproteobacteria bacterium]
LVSGRVLATVTSGDDLLFDQLEIGAGGAMFLAGELSGRATLEAGTPNARMLQGSQIGSSIVAKYTAAGSLVWATSMPSNVGRATVIHPLADGSVLVGGYFNDWLTLDQGLATQSTIQATGDGYNIYLVKLDANGRTVWARTAASGAIDGVFGIAARPDGSFVATGYFADAYDHTLTFPDGQSGPVSVTAPADKWETGWVGSFDAQGRLGWVRMLGGSSRVDKVRSVAFATNGDLLVAGAFAGDMTYQTSTGAQTIQQTGNTSYGTAGTYLARLSPSTGDVVTMHANGADSTVTSMVRDGSGLHLAAQTDRASAFDPTSTAPVNGAVPVASYLVRFDESFAVTRLQAVGTGFDRANLANLGNGSYLFSGYASAYRRFANGPNGEIDTTPVTSGSGLPPGFLACASPTRIVWSTSAGRSSAAALADDGTIVAVSTFEQTVTINAGTASAQTFTHSGFGRTSLLLRFTP